MDANNTVAQLREASVPSIKSSTTAFASNSHRGAWFIQNLGTNPLFIRLGENATTSLFHMVLRGGTANDDGTGGSISQAEGIVYAGIITVAGTDKRYTTLEL